MSSRSSSASCGPGFERNAIDLREAFAGKRCLDAGCGGGRATIMMAEAGAARWSRSTYPRPTCRRRGCALQQRGCDNVVGVEGSLLEVPFEDESFDVVWSNGVLHHTGDTDGSLKEITRVLRPGGWMWLYLYGSGGIYWHMVDWVRETLRDVDVSACIAQLRLQNVPVRRIAEWIDDWFVPVLQRYTVEDVRRRLEELGFSGATALAQGTHYDTSQRRIGASDQEIELMGDGDVRFWSREDRPALGQRRGEASRRARRQGLVLDRRSCGHADRPGSAADPRRARAPRDRPRRRRPRLPGDGLRTRAHRDTRTARGRRPVRRRAVARPSSGDRRALRGVCDAAGASCMCGIAGHARARR